MTICSPVEEVSSEAGREKECFDPSIESSVHCIVQFRKSDSTTRRKRGPEGSSAKT